MSYFGHQVAAGLGNGTIYAALALAICLTFQTTGVLNFAQGEFATLGACVAWRLISLGTPYWIAFAFTLLFSFAFGMALEASFLRPLSGGSPLRPVVATIGLSFLANSASGLLIGYNLKSFPSPFGDGLGLGSYLSAQQLGSIGLIGIAVPVLIFVLFRTRIGLFMRAVSLSPTTAELSGIRAKRIRGVAWGIATTIGTIAGVLSAPTLFLEPDMMAPTMPFAFAAAILAGLRRPLIAVAAGLAIGVAESIIGGYISTSMKLTLVLGIAILGLQLMQASKSNLNAR